MSTPKSAYTSIGDAERTRSISVPHRLETLRSHSSRSIHSEDLKSHTQPIQLPRALRFKHNKSFLATDPSPPMPETTEPPERRYRLVFLNDLDENFVDRNTEFGYPNNEVCTSQYTWWSFFPVFLYLTFSKVANIYFLMVGIFQMIPEISPTNGIPLQFIPLSIVITIDAIFAAYEDLKRHRADDAANTAVVQAYDRVLQQFEAKTWRELVVGDIVKVYNREEVPADVVILAVGGEEDGTMADTPNCFVETKSLDGETNLKLREAIKATAFEFLSEEECGDAVHGVLECEVPNGDINHFSGTLLLEGMQDQPGVAVDMSNMLLRGSKLRNTPHIYGLVVNTGVDTKIMMNSGDEFPVKQVNPWMVGFKVPVEYD